MDPRLRFCLLATLSLPFAWLASCLDYREELWLESNGAGKIHATIAVNSEIPLPDNTPTAPDQIEAQLRALFQETEGAEVQSYQTYDEGRKRIYDFVVVFRDIKQLKPALASGKGNIGALFGDFEIGRTPDGALSIQRTIHLAAPSDAGPSASDSAGDGEAPPSKPRDGLANQVGRALTGLVANQVLEDFHLDYVTHYPSEVISANSPNIDDATNTVTWRIPLADASQGPVEMTTVIKRPGNWMIWVFGLLVVIVTAGIVLPALRKRSR